MSTLVQLLRQTTESRGGAPAVAFYGGKSDRWSWSYDELWDYTRRVAAHLRDAGVNKGDRVVLWGPNRPEWIAAFFGTMLAGAVVVPLDLRSPEDLLTRIEEQTEPKHIFIGKEQAGKLKASHAPQTRLEDLRAILKNVAPADPADRPVAASDIAELVFTSGTTGNPKGVILTHGNIVADVRAGRNAVYPTPRNHVLSILPLSHMFEQTCGLLIPMSGGSTMYYVGSLRPDVIFDAMQLGRITNMSCVPQVLELFRDGIEREVRKQGKTKQFDKLVKVARYLPLPLRRRLFKQVHARMGGELEFLVSGGAYLDPGLANWWESLGFKIVQGYGMTEASPVVAAHSVNDRDAESVGRPLPGIDIRIAEDGEVLVRGENVTPGYWQNEEATAAAFKDGWYMTGDLGYFDKNGRLRLHGRKKNMIVMANGMNVYPEDVERALTSVPGVKDAAVFGLPKGRDIEVHAVLVLDKESGESNVPALIKKANAALGPHQHISGHSIWPDETFPLTPTLKAKRADILERLPALQAEGSAAKR